MAYWLDEGWHQWPEIDAVGTAAAGLYSRCGSYIAEALTDGFIPSARARMYGTPEWIARLVEVGLWTVEENGFRDTRYFPLNATKAEIERRRQQAAERQQRFRDRRGSTRESRVSNALRDAGQTISPSPPPKGGKGALRAVPDWCGYCHKDTRMAVDEHDRSVPCPKCSPRRSA